MPTGQTLCAILWDGAERPGGHDWYDLPVVTPYTRISDNTHWSLCWLRDEDVSDSWDTGYVSPNSGLLTDIDPGGDSIEVVLKVEVDGVLSNQNPDGRVDGDGPIIN